MLERQGQGLGFGLCQIPVEGFKGLITEPRSVFVNHRTFQFIVVDDDVVLSFNFNHCCRK